MRERRREGERKKERERERERCVPAILIMTSLFGISSKCRFPLLGTAQHGVYCDWSMSSCVSISLATGIYTGIKLHTSEKKKNV